jgi:RNA-binding protein
MALNPVQIRFLRGQAHHLKPVVIVGQHGLSENVIAEIEGALDAHELIKVRLNADDREDRREMIERIAAGASAELVQKIGHVAVFFRRNDDKPRLALPA